MKKSIVLLAFLIIGCGPKLDLGQFEPLVREFQVEGQKRLGIPININALIVKRAELQDDSGDILEGECIMGPFVTPTIYVNRLTWPYMDPYQQRAVLFHELGHCILLRPHKDTMELFTTGFWTSQRPTSLMNTYVPFGYFSSSTYLKYLDELFLER